MITLLAHSMMMFYFLGKGKAVREAAAEGGLSREYERRIAVARKPVFSIATLAMVATIVDGARRRERRYRRRCRRGVHGVLAYLVPRAQPGRAARRDQRAHGKRPCRRRSQSAAAVVPDPLVLTDVEKQYGGLRPLRVRDLRVPAGRVTMLARVRSPRRRGLRQSDYGRLAAGQGRGRQPRPLDTRHRRQRRMADVCRALRHRQRSHRAARSDDGGAESGHFVRSAISSRCRRQIMARVTALAAEVGIDRRKPRQAAWPRRAAAARADLSCARAGARSRRSSSWNIRRPTCRRTRRRHSRQSSSRVSGAPQADDDRFVDG